MTNTFVDVTDELRATGDLGRFPEGTTAARCECGTIRFSVPDDLTDEWKGHFDYCEGEQEGTG